ncbi:GNAT family N-acetyltransferase [Arthrobacter sp. RCC_34]|uniref:GNAT family N-acetyltransferase n=1 Tax=Arthrobacter sp. RCC_34 TaxID=3239230 RepID=UPI003525AD1B
MMLPNQMPRLEYGRVVLRAFESRDATLVQSVADDALIPSITTVPSSGTHEDALAFIARQHHRLAAGTGYSFAVTDSVSDVAVGQIGLWLRDIDQGRVTTGYWVAPAHRRRGYVTAALHALATWALELEEVERLQLYVEPWNRGSWQAAERCGFQREGLLRSWQAVGEARRDMFVYSKINESRFSQGPGPAPTPGR